MQKLNDYFYNLFEYWIGDAELSEFRIQIGERIILVAPRWHPSNLLGLHRTKKSIMGLRQKLFRTKDRYYHQSQLVIAAWLAKERQANALFLNKTFKPKCKKPFYEENRWLLEKYEEWRKRRMK